MKCLECMGEGFKLDIDRSAKTYRITTEVCEKCKGKGQRSLIITFFEELWKLVTKSN